MAEVVESTHIAGVWHVHPKVFDDPRGRFSETYRREWFPNGREMIQNSRSDKTANSLVGLHYHLRQSDYWYVVNGEARVALFDLRQGSPTEGKAEVFSLGIHNDSGVYIPPGVGHGFAAVTDMTLMYLVDGYYNPDDELGVTWNDPDLALDWGVSDPVVSDRDQANPLRADLAPEKLPNWTP